MSKPCTNCIQMLEGGAHALWEMVHFSPECLPPLPAKFESWQDLQQFLVRTAGHLREQTLKDQG